MYCEERYVNLIRNIVQLSANFGLIFEQYILFWRPQMYCEERYVNLIRNIVQLSVC